MIAAVLGAASPALAHQSPNACTKSGLVLNLDRSQTQVRNGDTINYQVTISNDATGSCDVTNATINVYLPSPSGQPARNPIRVVTGANYVFGFRETVVATVPYKVALNPGVSNATVRATVAGTLHDVPGDHPLTVLKELGTVMPPPKINVTKSASPPSGSAPLAVTYTYTVTNTSPLDLPVSNVVVTDDLCSSPAFTGGDADRDGALDVTETWTFACAMTHPNPGTFVDTAYACGDGLLGGEHVCAGPVQATVVVTAPPVTVSATPKLPAKCISVPKTLSVRARELTTVKITVTGAGVKGATVKLTGAGLNRTAKTNVSGVATFKVRPTKKGTLVVSSDRCLNAEQVGVKAARRTQSRQLPRVTG